MSHTAATAALAAAGALFLLGACSHERVYQRNGCWIKKVEGRWGDTREEISACHPNPPAWSPDPLVRAIEDCLYQEQLVRYNETVKPSLEGDEEPMERCLEHAQKIALERIDGLKRQVAAAEERATRMIDENKELRQTILACVEKSPNAIAEARATTDSTSGANSTHTAEKVRKTRKETTPAPMSLPGDPLPTPTVTPASATPGEGVKCVPEVKAKAPAPEAPKIR
jgi:hypothetical protein